MYSGPSPKSINAEFPDHTDEFIVCLLNGELRKKIQNNYLKKIGSSREEYIKLFPGAPLCSYQLSSVYKSIANSDEERNRRSQTITQLNLNDEDFQKKRLNGVNQFWKSGDSKELRNKLSDKAKIQHENGLASTVSKYFKENYINSQDQLLRSERLKNSEHPIHSIESRKKAIATIFKNYGVHNISFRNMSPDVYQLITNKDRFITFVTGKTICEISEHLQIGYATVVRYINLYDVSHLIDMKYSNLEYEFKRFLDEYNISYTFRDRQTISNTEIDFFLPKHNIGIEIHGLYYHSELKVKKDYHYNKYIKSIENGIDLFQIFGNEVEDLTKFEKWKKYLLYKMNIESNRTFARRTSILNINSKIYKQFLDKHHIQGSTNSSIRYGLFDDSLKLISVIGLSKQGNNLLLDRFSSSMSIPGGFSKLLKHVSINNDYDNIITFSDNRYSNGNLYKKTGFVEDSKLMPDYYYTDFVNLFHKFNFRKQLIKTKFDIDISNKTEHELCSELGFYRIYDAGKIKWILPKI